MTCGAGTHKSCTHRTRTPVQRHYFHAYAFVSARTDVCTPPAGFVGLTISRNATKLFQLAPFCATFYDFPLLRSSLAICLFLFFFPLVSRPIILLCSRRRLEDVLLDESSRSPLRRRSLTPSASRCAIVRKARNLSVLKRSLSHRAISERVRKSPTLMAVLRLTFLIHRFRFIFEFVRHRIRRHRDTTTTVSNIPGNFTDKPVSRNNTVAFSKFGARQHGSVV